VRECAGAGEGLDAAHATRHAALADDHQEADLRRVAHVRAAAQLHGLAGHVHHAHHVAVLLAEQRHGAAGLGFVDGHDLGGHRAVLADLFVDDGLDALELLGLDGLEVAEVESQALVVDQGALLMDVIAQHLAQCGVQQVGTGVVQGDALAAIGVDLGHERGTDVEAALGHHAVVQEGALRLGGVAHGKANAGAFQGAGIADLATGFTVERRLVEDDHALFVF